MKLCMGCMESINDSEFICPYCGYDERRDTQEAYYLPQGTVIAGKYIAGRALQYNGYVISYIGWDAVQECKVQIQEYMASDYATRVRGEQDLTIYSGEATREYERGLSLFMNEGSSMQRLSGLPGIAAVYDCCVENSTGYLVTEYLMGKTLKEILDAGKRYAFEEAYKFLQPVLSSLCSLHEAGIMHYDIAPENIVLTVDGKVKLINFGATRYMTSSKSKSLAVILKQGYAPEEQYRSQGKKGAWSDVYSIAAVFYRMITGIVPEESVERSVDDHLKDPSKCGVFISKSQENALMNALNIYANDRTKTMRQFCDELKNSNVKRIRVKQKNSEKSWAVKKIGIAALAIVVILCGGVIFLKNQKNIDVVINKDQVVMPNIIEDNEDYNKYVEECNEADEKYNEETIKGFLENAGFSKEKIKIKYVYSDVNSIISQKPLSGERFDLKKAKKQSIKITIGSKKYITLTKQDIEDMQEKFEGNKEKYGKNKLNLLYGISKKNIGIAKPEDNWNDSLAEDTIYEIQGLNNGNKIEVKKIKVTLVLSRGSKDSYTIKMPPLKGIEYNKFKDSRYKCVDQKSKRKIIHERCCAIGKEGEWGNVEVGDIVETSIKEGEDYFVKGSEGEKNKEDKKESCRVYVLEEFDFNFDSMTEKQVKSKLKEKGIIATKRKNISDNNKKEGVILETTKLKEGDSVYYDINKHRELKTENNSDQSNSSTNTGGTSGQDNSSTNKGGTSGQGDSSINEDDDEIVDIPDNGIVDLPGNN